MLRKMLVASVIIFALVIAPILPWTNLTPIALADDPNPDGQTGGSPVGQLDNPPPPESHERPGNELTAPVVPIPDDTIELRAALATLEAARMKGPEAVLTLRETLTGVARDMAMDEFTEAQEQIERVTPPPPETAPVSEAEEQTANLASESVEAANRAQAWVNYDDPNEGQSLQQTADPFQPDLPAVDRTVGSPPCTYATISAAITAASPGDRLLIEGNVTFVENLTIYKNLTLQGGYNGCGSASANPTTINGNATNSVVNIWASYNVTLQNLIITNGNSSGEGGGIVFAKTGAGTSTLTLNNVTINNNTALWGGGLWVGLNAEVVGTVVNIYNNTATSYGGGVRLYGGRATFSASNIYSNNAPLGGGVYGTKQDIYSPSLQLPTYADLHDNQALTGSGFGGGVYLRQGDLTLTDCSDIYLNDSIYGGGAYLITSTLTIRGDCSEIDSNTATRDGGGIYAQDSHIYLQDQAEILSNQAGLAGAYLGGGAYIDHSTLRSEGASIYFNTASWHGGGVYATNNSFVNMGLGSSACLTVRCSQVSHNTSSAYGGGIYAINSTIYLDNTFIETNAALYGGGIYAYLSSISAFNNLFAENNATASVGDGIRLFTSSSMSSAGNTLANNDAGGAATGRAIDISGGSLTLDCSIIWNHASSIDLAGQAVTYSDIQGGYVGTGNLNVNPLFVAPASSDFHLQFISPVIDHCAYFSGMDTDFDNESRPIVRTTPSTPYDMGADEFSVPRVGINGACSYGTIQQAVNAANAGDTIRVSAGLYTENVDIGKSLTIQGGYDSSCTTISGGTTTVDGSYGTGIEAGSVFDISTGTLTLSNLGITGGDSMGGGIDAFVNARVTLDSLNIYGNTGDFGGGIWIDASATVTMTNGTLVHDNTAASAGGGVRVWGKFFGYDTNSDTYQNSAPEGGGFSVSGGTLYLDNADVKENHATGPTGRGGGILVESGGTITLTNSVFVGEATPQMNTAYDGAGIYADASTVYLLGPDTSVINNTASHYGGGVYLKNSTLYATGGRIGHDAFADVGNDAILGAGLYVENSTVNFSGLIFNNIASMSGAGIYATGGTLNLTDATIGGITANQANQLGATGHEGVGLFITGTLATLNNTTIISNTFQTTFYTYGGGALADGNSVLTLVNSSVENHRAPDSSDGRGAGIYIRDSTVTLNNSQLIHNIAGTLGGGIRLYGTSTLNILNGSTMSYNQSLTGEGGGIAATLITGSPTIQISSSKLDHNTAGTNGGAIYLDAGTMTVSHTILHHNSAMKGGAIFQTGTATSNIDNNLIYKNTSTTGFGAGIRSEGGSFTIWQTTLADNIGGAGYSQSSTVGGAYNNIAWGNSLGGFEKSDSSTITNDCNIDQSAIVGNNIDPQFVNPTNNNYHLQQTSPAIDACLTGLSPDLDNISRPRGSRYDMGAYEFFQWWFYLPIMVKKS